MKYMKVLFIEKIKCAARSRVRSIIGGAIDCSPACVRSYDVCSVTSLCTFDCGRCVRSHKLRSIADNCLRIPTAQVLKRWSIGPTRATCETRVHVAALDRTVWGQDFNFCSITPFSTPICTKDLQHSKTLK